MPVSTALLSISFRVPSKRALPPGSPHRAPTDGDVPFPEPSFIHFQSPQYMSPPPGSPAGLIWREMPISRAFLYITFRVPSKGPPLQVPLTELPQREKDAPFLEPSFIHLSNSLVNKPPSRFPSRRHTMIFSPSKRGHSHMVSYLVEYSECSRT
jgi:hypothetical protein